MAFKDEFDNTERSSSNNDFFKFEKDGDYKFRIMSEPAKKISRFGFGIAYQGAKWATKEAIDADWEAAKEKARAEGKDPEKVRRNGLRIQWEMWAINRATGKLVLLDLTDKTTQKLRAFMDSDEYKFSEFPMPYDITISVTDAGTIDAEYSMLPARKETEITPEEKEEFEKLTPVSQIIDRMKAKAREKDGVPAPTEDGEKQEEEIAAGDPGAKPDNEINPEEIPF
jgi:hypothetical protein